MFQKPSPKPATSQASDWGPRRPRSISSQRATSSYAYRLPSASTLGCRTSKSICTCPSWTRGRPAGTPTVANFQLCIQGRAEINLTMRRRVLAGSAGDDDNLCSARVTVLRRPSNLACKPTKRSSLLLTNCEEASAHHLHNYRNSIAGSQPCITSRLQ